MAEVYNNIGLVLDKANFKVVKKQGKAGDTIPKHNHPEANVTFTVISGKVKAYINEVEEHILNAGDILSFNGDNYINAEFVEAGEAVVHLVNKI